MIERRFLLGLVAAFLTLGIAAAALDLLLIRVGEVDLGYVVDRQLAAAPGTVLFASGINQHAYHYKMMLYDRLKPAVVAIGSSRAMVARSAFFKGAFVSLGGAANNVAELEQVVSHIAAGRTKPALALVFVDPWWFNSRYSGNARQATIPDYPLAISFDLMLQTANDLRHGNWIAAAWRSPNLGLYALLYDEGFEQDGSYDYLGTLVGEHRSDDAGFSDTLSRVREHRNRFEEGDRADSGYLERMCVALRTLRMASGHVVLVAPPFSPTVWKAMAGGRYGYLTDAYTKLQDCANGVPFLNLVNPVTIAGMTDCEFVDGVHGGDTVYARIARAISRRDPVAGRYINTGNVDAFIQRYGGTAGGIALSRIRGGREVDFLGIGCLKR